VSLSLDTYSIWQKVFKFNNEASDVYRQCLWSGCGVSFTARGSEWISAVPSSRRGATIRKASNSFFNLAGSISFDPNATKLARISLLLLMLGTSLKESFSHLSVALSGTYILPDGPMQPIDKRHYFRCAVSVSASIHTGTMPELRGNSINISEGEWP
jgi:hypothetical protein